MTFNFLHISRLTFTVVTIIFSIIPFDIHSDDFTGERKKHPQRMKHVNFGVILNDDGDNSFQDNDHKISEKKLRADMQAIKKAGIKTLTYNLGPSVLNYPTYIGSRKGWQNRSFEEKKYGHYIKARHNLANDFDPIRIASQNFRDNAQHKFLISLRMNDAHFTGNAKHSPLTTQFWHANQNLIIGLDKSPLISEDQFDASFKIYGNLLNFNHDKVCQHILAIIDEAINRYAPFMDGIELDFNRSAVFFPQGEVKPDILTNIISLVRDKLNTFEDYLKRPLYLFVRVQPTIKHCTWAGLDLEEWVRQELVDVIIPSQLMHTSQNTPLQNLIKLAHDHDVQVYPTIFSRKNESWPFTPYDWEKNFKIQARPTLGGKINSKFVYAAASNMFHMGADGVQLYNWAYRTWINKPFFEEMVTTLSDQNLTLASDREHALDVNYYFSYKDTIEDRKVLPAVLKANQSRRFPLILGKLDIDNYTQATMRIGFSEEKYTKLQAKIKINKIPTQEQIIDRALIPTNYDKSQIYTLLKPQPAASFYHLLLNLASLTSGENIITLTFNQGVQIQELEILLSKD